MLKPSNVVSELISGFTCSIRNSGWTAFGQTLVNTLNQEVMCLHGPLPRSATSLNGTKFLAQPKMVPCQATFPIPN